MRAFAFVVLIALFSAPGLRSQAPKLPPIIRSGLEAYKQAGTAVAMATWLKDSPITNESTVAAQAGFERIEGAYGHMIGYDVLQIVTFGPHASRSYVIILYQKGPVYAWFDCYDATERWIITGFLFNTKPDAILAPAMLGH
jgi:hypothetical protein